VGQEGWLGTDGGSSRVLAPLPEGLRSPTGYRVHAVGAGFVGRLHLVKDPEYSIVLKGDKNIVSIQQRARGRNTRAGGVGLGRRWKGSAPPPPSSSHRNTGLSEPAQP